MFSARYKSLIGHLDMQGVFICLRINGYSFNAQLFAGTDDSDGDFSSVGDQ